MQIGYIPTAAATCRRIAGRLAISGAEYRESHPQLANELAALINGVERGTELYVGNQNRKFNIHEVRQCLDGLGDGDPSKNVDAVKAAVRAMYDAGIGYGTITFSQDTCRECGYRGIIDNECPHCHTKDNGENVLRIRRITGYLVGRSSQSIEESWGDGKLAELKHRVNI